MGRRRTAKPAPARAAMPVDPPSSPPLAGRLLFGLLLLTAFLLSCTPMRDTDIWWHLRTGQLIWERGTVPWVDWFTYTDSDKAWIDLHWGFQLLMAGLYALGGVDLLILSQAVCLTLTVAVGWWGAGRRLPAWAKVGCWLVPLVCLSGRAYVRPEMLTLLFLALWLAILFRLEEHPRWIWWLPVIQVVWINCHALFVLGLVVGACYVADRLVRTVARGRWGLEPPPVQPRATTVFYAGLLSLLAGLANPYFEEGFKFPLVLYRKFSVEQEFYGPRIGEFHQPWMFLRQYGWNALTNLYFDAELLLWLITAVSFLWLFMKQHRWSVLRLLLFAAVSHLAWEASRNTNLFALVCGFLLCENVQDAVSQHEAVSSDQWPERRRWNTVAAGVLILWMLAVVTNLWAALGRENKRFGLGEARNWYPHAAAKFAGQPGMPLTAFVANFGHASVYEFHNGPERRVFMDGRLEVVTRQTFAAFEEINRKIAAGDPTWQTDLLAYGPLPTLIFDSRYARPQIQGAAQTPGWVGVFADASAAVFVPASVAQQLKLPPADPTPILYPPED